MDLNGLLAILEKKYVHGFPFAILIFIIGMIMKNGQESVEEVIYYSETIRLI